MADRLSPLFPPGEDCVKVLCDGAALYFFRLVVASWLGRIFAGFGGAKKRKTVRRIRARLQHSGYTKVRKRKARPIEPG